MQIKLVVVVVVESLSSEELLVDPTMINNALYAVGNVGNIEVNAGAYACAHFF